MELLVSGKTLSLTDAITAYANKKLQTLEKFFDNIIKVEVVVGMETKRHQKGDIFFAECKLAVPGTELFAKTEGIDVYQALDLLKDEMEKEVKKYKQKLKGNEKKKKTIGRQVKEYNTDINSDDIL